MVLWRRQVADVAVVTATRDGMNLVPYEYVVCRQGPPGEAAEARRESMLVVSGAGTGCWCCCCWHCCVAGRAVSTNSCMLLRLVLFCWHLAAAVFLQVQSLWAARPACLAPSVSTPGPLTRWLMPCTAPSRRQQSTAACGMTSTGSETPRSAARGRVSPCRQQPCASCSKNVAAPLLRLPPGTVS